MAVILKHGPKLAMERIAKKVPIIVRRSPTTQDLAFWVKGDEPGIYFEVCLTDGDVEHIVKAQKASP